MTASLLLAIVLAQTVTIDRIAATVDKDVIAVSQVRQVIAIRLIPRNEGEEGIDYRRRVLDSLIAQALRYRDVQRFGGSDVSPDAIEARLLELQRRFDSPAEFDEALVGAELTIDEVRALVKRQLQVEAYIQERFAPLVFISVEEIENYYRDTWLPGRTERGLPPQPLDSVSEEIRATLRAQRLAQEIDVWTAELRERANVDVFVYR